MNHLLDHIRPADVQLSIQLHLRFKVQIPFRESFGGRTSVNARFACIRAVGTSYLVWIISALVLYPSVDISDCT